MNSYPPHPSVAQAPAAHPQYMTMRHPYATPMTTIPPYHMLPYPPHPQHPPQIYYNRPQRYPHVLPPHPMFPYPPRSSHHPLSIPLISHDINSNNNNNNGYQHPSTSTSSTTSTQTNWNHYTQGPLSDHPVSASYPLPHPSATTSSSSPSTSSPFVEYKQIHNSFLPKGVDSNGETTPYNVEHNHYSSIHDDPDSVSHSVQVLPMRDNGYDISTSSGSNIESMRSLNGTTATSLLKRERADDEVDEEDEDGVGYIETFKKSCDHCIKLKKKCIKYVEEDKCEICLKRNIDCIYSKQRKRGRLPMLADSSKKLVLHPAPPSSSSQFYDTKRSYNNNNRIRKRRSELSLKDDISNASSSNTNTNNSTNAPPLVDQN